MPNFEEATRLAEELFAQEQAEQTENGEPVQEVPEEVAEPTEVPAEVPTEEAPPETPIDESAQAQMVKENAMLDEATNTAQMAAQMAQEKDMQLQQMMQELEALRSANQQMQGTLEELSRRNEENLIEEALEMPTLDINGLAFADADTMAKAQSDYAQKMAAYVRGGVMKELEPFVTQAKEGMYQKERESTLSALSEVPELQGIKDMLPQLDRIIASNKWLSSDDMSIEEKYINAYAIARGVNAINTPPEEPKELTDDDLMELYDKNPTFQELIEKKRIEAIKNSQQVPPFSASSGAVNAALNIEEKPKTFEEASERTRKMFGLG